MDTTTDTKTALPDTALADTVHTTSDAQPAEGFGRQLLRLLELEVPTAATPPRPTATTGFDRSYTALAVLTVLGIFVDVYSHATFGPDQTVLNPYHLLFYTSVLALGLLLVVAHRQGQEAGFGWSTALPRGYGQALLAVLLFGLAGAVDLVGHALFGFETGAEAVLSPSHQVLMLCVVLIGLAPLRSVLPRTRDVDWSGMVVVGPSTVVVMAGLTLLGLLYTPLAGWSLAVQEQRLDSQYVAIALENAQLYVQNAIVVGTLLWLLRQVRLPRGAIAATLLGWASVLVLMELDALPWVLVGVGAVGIDALAGVLRPSESAVRLRLFGLLAPLPLWLGFYGLVELVDLGGGLWFSGYVWLGAVAHCAGIGAVMALLLTSRPPVAVASGGPAPRSTPDAEPSVGADRATPRRPSVPVRATTVAVVAAVAVALGTTGVRAAADTEPAPDVQAEQPNPFGRLLGSTEESITNRLPVGPYEVDVDGSRLLGDTDLRIRLTRPDAPAGPGELAGLDVRAQLTPSSGEGDPDTSGAVTSEGDERVEVGARARWVDGAFVTPQLPVTAAGAYELTLEVREPSGAVHRGTTQTLVYPAAVELGAGATAGAVVVPLALLAVVLARSRRHGRLVLATEA